MPTASDQDVPISFQWSVSIGGQTVASSNDSTLNYTPEDDGDYEFQLTVTDAEGAEISEVYTVAVHNVSPSIDEYSVPTQSLIGETLNLTADVSDPAGANDPLVVQWSVDGPGDNDFESPDSAFGFSPHTGGLYDVLLSVMDDDDGITTMTQSIWVSDVADSVEIIEGTVFISGAESSDAFEFDWMDGMFAFDLNGATFLFDEEDATSFAFDGNGGDDVAAAVGSPGDDTAEMAPSSAMLVGDGYSIEIFDVDTIVLDGDTGQDVVTMDDSIGDDEFTATHDEAMLTGDGYENTAINFESVRAIATTGDNRATLNDTVGRRYVSRDTGTWNSVRQQLHHCCRGIYARICESIGRGRPGVPL